MPRQARLDAPGTLHHVILRGIEKKPIVNNARDRDDFVSRLGQLAVDTQTDIYAWCLMPNHAHLLLKSGPHGLSKFMRRFLTGYAVSYNRRHGRSGHLFHNRYKSIVCEEDAYFLELVRYIHLNPIRAGLVEDVRGLERYPWCGHGTLMGRVSCEWQNRRAVLAWFGEKERTAVKAYMKYLTDGAGQGKRPELVGGGLVRSAGGWSEVVSLRKKKEKTFADERILGSEAFVRQIIGEAEEKWRRQLPSVGRMEEVGRFTAAFCDREGVQVKELQGGSRRGVVSRARRKLVHALVETFGTSLAEAARQAGVSSSAISRILMKGKGEG